MPSGTRKGLQELMSLSSLTGAQLKEIARLCGCNKSGTKAVISDRIISSIEGSAPLSAGNRVLSIDLGIRNLAYCLLEVPSASRDVPVKGTAKRRRKDLKLSCAVAKTPIICAWERLTVIPKLPKPAPPKKGRKKKGCEDDSPQDEIIPGKKGPLPPRAPTEDFSPSRLSKVAVHLVLNHFIPLKPDVVTLERQHFRTHGGSAVLEWTLRVNSLESMLYAGFTALQETGFWPREGRLEPVFAAHVLDFMMMQDGEGGVEVKGSRQRSADIKKIKENMAGRMLVAKERVQVSQDAECTVQEYLDEWQGKKKGQRDPDRRKKLDDLADCLLQGVAFVHWQANKKELSEGGVDALLGPGGGIEARSKPAGRPKRAV